MINPAAQSTPTGRAAECISDLKVVCLLRVLLCIKKVCFTLCTLYESALEQNCTGFNGMKERLRFFTPSPLHQTMEICDTQWRFLLSGLFFLTSRHYFKSRDQCSPVFLLHFCYPFALNDIWNTVADVTSEENFSSTLCFN